MRFGWLRVRDALAATFFFGAVVFALTTCIPGDSFFFRWVVQQDTTTQDFNLPWDVRLQENTWAFRCDTLRSSFRPDSRAAAAPFPRQITITFERTTPGNQAATDRFRVKIKMNKRTGVCTTNRVSVPETIDMKRGDNVDLSFKTKPKAGFQAGDAISVSLLPIFNTRAGAADGDRLGSSGTGSREHTAVVRRLGRR